VDTKSIVQPVSILIVILNISTPIAQYWLVLGSGPIKIGTISSVTFKLQ